MVCNFKSFFHKIDFFPEQRCLWWSECKDKIMGNRKGKLFISTSAALLISLLTMGSAAAASGNYGKAWPINGGWQYVGYVQIKPCERLNGRHPRVGYLRFKRDAEGWDSGRLHTESAFSPSCDIKSRTETISDKPTMVTSFFWGVDKYFD